MSFNINGPENKPVIREAQTMMNDGGAGNTGYMMAGKRKKENEEELPKESNAKDTFEKSSEQAQEDEIANSSPSLFKKIIDTILKFFASFFEKPTEKPENKDFLSLSMKDVDKK